MNDFSLIETMLCEPGTGIARASLHWARLRNSAAKLGFSGAPAAWDAVLTECAMTESLKRLRLELFRDGRFDIAGAAFVPLHRDVIWRVAIARKSSLESGQPLLRHKTSLRDIYQRARAEFPIEDVEEVLLANEAGAICEGTITNIFLEMPDGMLLTPPLSSGCLAGVLRTSLICARKARVGPVSEEDLRAYPFFVGNSLRGLVRAQLV